MGSTKMKVKHLKTLNYKTNTSRSIALSLINHKNYKHLSIDQKIELLKKIHLHPEDYLQDETLGKLATDLTEVVQEKNFQCFELKPKPEPYKVYGKPFISANTIQQMDVAMQLPIAVKGALMPDAHLGYGLPIGGVLATKNEVIPYGIGLDIGCRMSLSIYPIPSEFMNRHSFQLKRALQDQTHFGIGQLQDTYEEHAVLDRNEFHEIDILRKFHGKAKGQIGTSGSGNHFVEFGKVVLSAGNPFGMNAGEYMGVLAHSGSRGLGAAIANYYMRVAMDTCKLPKGAKHLAWLDLNTQAGQEYWLAMNLAGDYAKACHDVIHRKISRAIGVKAHVKVENHHNFAWKETQVNGEELIVHRKGATPAKNGQLGIIPATMQDPGYIVSGLGASNSLFSASHGAGRKVSRGQAKSSWTKSEMTKSLKTNKITLIGGGVDESPMAYKNIEQVMASQRDLVEVEGMFYPQIVRMDKN